MKMNRKYFKGFGYYAKRILDLYNYIFGDFPPKLKKMDYENYWKAKASFEFSLRYPVFAEVIEEGSSVLDIGCGNGATLKFLKEQKNVKGEGIDISQEAVKIARSKGLKAFVADISSPDFRITNEYDYIILSEVLEHVPNPEEIMEKVKGKFRKMLIVSIPNIGHYMHRLRLLFGRFPIQWVYHPGEHLRFWTVKDFKKWVNYLGFRIVDICTFTGFLFLHKFMPNLLADSVIFLLKEIEK